MTDPPAQSRKILPHGQLLDRITEAKAAGKTIVQCHGCFDLVHPGHIRHLQYASQLGDILLVSITGDTAVNKGDGRPLIPQELRAENLAALDCVDWVYIDARPTAVTLLTEVKPDAYIKGREYEHNRDPRFAAERDVVESNGGRVVFSSGDIVFSSTALIAGMTDEIGADDPASLRINELTARDDLRCSRLDEILDACIGRHIVVIGELIRDTYIHCDRPEIASEAAIMTLRPIQRVHYDGGTAIIAKHITAMGARATIVTAAADDPGHVTMIERLRSMDIDVLAIPMGTPLLEKQRYLVGRDKVIKIDLTQPITLDGQARDQLTKHARDVAHSADAAIICDYGGGLLTPSLVETLCQSLRPAVPVLTGDVSGHRANLTAMREMNFVCPNETELREGMRDFGESLSSIVWRLLAQQNIKSAIVTLGDEGLIAFEQTQGSRQAEAWTSRLRSDHVPAMARHVVDELGCGDSLLAVATLATAAGASLSQAAYLGSLAAASQVERRGNAVIGRSDVGQLMRRFASAHLVAAAVR